MTYPTHVVANQVGYMYTSAEDGGPFTLETATDFADHMNDAMKPEYRTWKVFALVAPEQIDTVNWVMDVLVEGRAIDDEYDQRPGLPTDEIDRAAAEDARKYGNT
jgi:hypothetical protein